MKRSDVLAMTAAALAAPALRAVGQTLEHVRFGAVPVEEAALAFYAKEKGFFTAAGLDVDLQILGNGGAVSAALGGNALDVGVTNSGSMALAHARGVPIELVACGALFTPASPIAHLAVGKTAGIKTAKDLTGKTLAVSTLRDMIQATALLWIDKNGGDSKTVNFVEVPPPQQGAAIVSKRIDGAVIVEPFYTGAKNDVIELGTTYSAVNDEKPFQTLGIAGASGWVSANPATARKVAGAIHAAARWANASKNHAECVTILTQYTKVLPAVITSYQRLAFAERNSPSFVQPVVDLMAKYGMIAKGFSADEMFATSTLG
jgi:NitT/TauT family transport system substrate-binding protein